MFNKGISSIKDKNMVIKLLRVNTLSTPVELLAKNELKQ
jgi:hypothetical protein